MCWANDSWRKKCLIFCLLPGNKLFIDFSTERLSVSEYQNKRCEKMIANTSNDENRKHTRTTVAFIIIFHFSQFSLFLSTFYRFAWDQSIRFFSRNPWCLFLYFLCTFICIFAESRPAPIGPLTLRLMTLRLALWQWLSLPYGTIEFMIHQRLLTVNDYRFHLCVSIHHFHVYFTIHSHITRTPRAHSFQSP